MKVYLGCERRPFLCPSTILVSVATLEAGDFQLVRKQPRDLYLTSQQLHLARDRGCVNVIGLLHVHFASWLAMNSFG